MDRLKPLWDNRDLLMALGIAVYALARLLRWARDAYIEFKGWLQGLVREEVPAAVKSSLSNGGGDIIRRIVAEENAKQTQHHRDAIAAHEAAWHARKEAACAG